MKLSAEEAAHLAGPRDESELIALVNQRILELGGEMIPVRNGSVALPEPEWPRAPQGGNASVV